MRVIFGSQAKKDFLKLDKTVQRHIQRFVLRLQELSDPRMSGKALVGNYAGLWRYRVGDYRLICEIHDEKILVTVLRIAHRKEVYRD